MILSSIKIDEMAILTSDNSDSYSVDGIVDSRIITEEASSATKMEGDDEGMLGNLYSFFQIKCMQTVIIHQVMKYGIQP